MIFLFKNNEELFYPREYVYKILIHIDECVCWLQGNSKLKLNWEECKTYIRYVLQFLVLKQRKKYILDFENDDIQLITEKKYEQELYRNQFRFLIENISSCFRCLHVLELLDLKSLRDLHENLHGYRILKFTKEILVHEILKKCTDFILMETYLITQGKVLLKEYFLPNGKKIRSILRKRYYNPQVADAEGGGVPKKSRNHNDSF